MHFQTAPGLRSDNPYDVQEYGNTRLVPQETSKVFLSDCKDKIMDIKSRLQEADQTVKEINRQCESAIIEKMRELELTLELEFEVYLK